VRETIEALDQRGILQSIASRNDRDSAMAKLRKLDLDQFFLYPQINWGSKSSSILSIARDLNIATNALAFVDDDPFERDEVAAGVPEVLCIDGAEGSSLLDLPAFNPRFITEDAKRRRSMYRAEIQRQRVEAEMAPEDFLRSLDMVFTISRAEEQDLQRLEELTVRTNQLNSTGQTYSHEELDQLRHSAHHRLLIAGLDDVYGTYGKIGMVVVEEQEDVWLLKLILMSCRVMARGVGRILLSHVLQLAKAAGKRVRADFLRTDRNRMMYLTFKLAGFEEIARSEGVAVLEHDLGTIDPFPEYVDVRVLSP
jgi:FkbH-like protein